MPAYYPIYLAISGRLCVVVGGGAVAERRIIGLREAGAKIKVVSPTLTPELQKLADANSIEAIVSIYEAVHLNDAFLVVAATNYRAVNAQVIADAQARALLVNAADALEEGDYIVPAVVRRGALCLSVATGGNTPTLTARLSRELAAQFGPEWANYVHLCGAMRDLIKENFAEPERRAVHARLTSAETELLALLREDRTEAAYALAHRIVFEPSVQE